MNEQTQHAPRIGGALWAAALFLVLSGPAAARADRPAAQPPRWPDSAESLRGAIQDLAADFPQQYRGADRLLAELDQLEREFGEHDAVGKARMLERLESLRRRALLANPLVCGQPIVFVVRPQYLKDHHNTATMFQTGEINTASFRGGGAIKTIDLADAGRVTTLLQVPQGLARDLDVHFSGQRILLSLRHDIADDYHLYELDAHGSGLRQLTVGQGLSDIDPIYLPDDRVLFTSTREPKYCMCNRHIMGNLFVMDAQAGNAPGGDIQQIGHSTLHEGHAALLPDGRVAYDRWEYVDRNFGDAQGLWSVNPDGVNHALYWGNNTNSPGAVLDVRPLSDGDRFLATFSSCHDRPWGALALVDRRLGMDGRGPVVRTWPPSARALVEVGNYDTFKKVAPKYEDPYPLSDKYFLCVRTTGRGEETGIFLIDVFGNEILVHAESPGCFDPLPLGPRRRPPVIPTRIDRSQSEGYLYVQDVYAGAAMAGVSRGSVRYLRVVESPEKRFWTPLGWNGGTGQQAPGMAWDDFNNKRILGTVPVEPDGSAYFSVPADTFVYFQLLDQRRMMVQSMRSGTIVRPGETLGCVGCHEDRRTSARALPTGQAWRRGPRSLEPWYGPRRLFSYAAEVQPVLDRRCASCHDYGLPAGEKLNLAGDAGLVFNTSYVELRSKRYVHVVGAGPFQVQPPRSWGSHASPLVRVLLEGHGDPEIDRQTQWDEEDFQRIVAWVDINAPYYPDYAGDAYRQNPFGRSPLTAAEVEQLETLTGVKTTDPRWLSQISFRRPELSPCLSRLAGSNDARYAAALAILRAGQERLAARPRADMPGYRLQDQQELAQQRKYQALATGLPREGGG